MGKGRYNAKARQVVKTDIDNSKTSEIQLEFATNEYGATDSTNLLALPSKKRETKIVREKKEKTRFLSKAQRKRLEKIVEKKKKKENWFVMHHASYKLLCNMRNLSYKITPAFNHTPSAKSLSQVQASAAEVQQLTGISAVQTIGLRKLNELNSELTTQAVTEETENKKFSSIAGAKKRLRLLKMDNAEKIKKKKYDPNVVGLEESSEDSSSESEEESDDDEPEIVNGHDTNEKETPNPTDKVDITVTDKNDSEEQNTVKIVEKKVENVKKNSEKDIKVEKKPLLEHPTVHVEVKRDPKIQIPQFLYEAGYAEHKMIAVTEPRRVATVAMAARVGYELGLSNKEVSYLMRFEEREMKRARKARRKAKKKSKTLPKINLDDYDMPEDDGQADLVDDEDSEGHLSDSDAEEDSLTPAIKSCRQPLWVLPLYSMLNQNKQARIFNPPPAGARLCVVSTDVAETSITIPSIRYVVDTGKKKMRVYDHVTGASAWRIVWTSQASAEQRAGRAGRVSSGHAYRLYSSAVFQHECPEQHPPDLCRRPVDDLVLTMKCMGIDKVVNFPFPTAPDRMQLRLAEKRLEALGILEKPPMKDIRKDDEEVLKVTPLGKAVSAFPLLPRYGKMLALSHQQNLLPFTIALVSALTVPEVMTGKPDSWPATGNVLLLGDPGVLLRAIGAAEYAYAIKEIRKLRKQLTSEINLSVAGVDVVVDPEMKPPNDNQARLLRHVIKTLRSICWPDNYQTSSSSAYIGEPLDDPPPRYDEKSGRVKCHFKGTFEGAVFPKLKKYTGSLLSPPSTMVKSWAKLQPRTEVLLKALIAKRAGSRDALRSVWEENGSFLLDEYLKWVPESAHNEVSLYWPPLK
ncbi:hypothetical protein HF086_007801 [Spodoptera exigua]|uniref:Helicase C-terminal domain-containing protein n=1 Tax=Spodoptera exigua TaxID=7107 RepID=A0A922SGR3_SPOEX|nr:hypothetical protein HF086_007801 [Spodoptera exigua]